MPENPAVAPETVRIVHEKLLEKFGSRTPSKRDPLDGLILILLSQATNDINTDRAFTSLKAAFPDWKLALDAPTESIADAIRRGGLANQKAARIKEILRQIWEEQGDFDLSFLHDKSADECEKYLGQFHGVGPKTIACVLMFFLDKPAFAVDTHVFRILRRLGWIREKASVDEAHRVCKILVPDEYKLDLHINMIAHGRVTCRADGNGGPKCGDCIIKAQCDFGRDLPVTPGKTVLAPSADPDFFVTIKQKKDLEKMDEIEDAVI